MVFLAPLVEELLFRGFLLPRMRSAFGKRDWGRERDAVHAVPRASAVEHAGNPARRYLRRGVSDEAIPEHVMGIVTQTLPSFLITGVILSLVLK